MFEWCARVLWLLAAILLLPFFPHSVASDEPPVGRDPVALSLPLRTALHHDPSLAAPLEQLLAMFRERNRVDDLLAIYKNHLGQFPNDVHGETVFVRLLAATGSPESAGRAKAAIERFPQNAYLRYLHFEARQTRHDPQALDELDAAIGLEASPARQSTWIDRLVPLAVTAGRKDLAEKHLKRLAALADAPEAKLDAARKMNQHKFHQLSLATLQADPAKPPAPETMVSWELEAVTAEVGLGQRGEAGARLDRLLGKLTADHWRRPEIVARRLALLDTPEAREALVVRARERVKRRPGDIAAVLDLVQVLSGLQQRKEALALLLAAGNRYPASQQIEQQTLEMFDRLRDERGREAYLASRIKSQPQRQDLAVQRVKTMFDLARREEALAAWNDLAKTLPDADRLNGTLDMARHVRRAGLIRESADLFRQALQQAPTRLDVQRELAEVYLLSGNRGEVRQLFADPLPKEAALENFLDLVQFLVKQNLFLEAATALRARLPQEATNLDVRLLLADVERRLGNTAAGEKLLDDSRTLADTGARYRAWLEAAAAFHQEADTLDDFLAAERARLDDEPVEWTERRAERRLAFLDIGSKGASHAQAMIDRDLKSSPPADVRIKLRERMLALLEIDPKQTASVQRQLEELATEFPARATLYRAKLALLHAKSNRLDLAAATLPHLDLREIADPTVLSALRPLYEQSQQPAKVTQILERLTTLDPTNRSHWEQWLTALAISGDEARLREVLRSLLAGIEKLPLSEPTRRLLEQHLVDSYWRSIAQALADDEPDYSHVLVLIDAVERSHRDDEQWQWSSWIRAFALGRLGRERARDEALAELDRSVALRPPETTTGEPPREPRVVFPDGLSIATAAAKDLLTRSPEPTFKSSGSRRSPLPPFRLKWAYEVAAGNRIVATIDAGESRRLIVDSAGTVACLDSETGKLLWKKDGLVATSGASPRNIAPVWNGYGYSPPDLARLAQPTILVDGQGRMYVGASGKVSCFSLPDGALQWHSEIGSARSTVKPELLAQFASQGQIQPTSPVVFLYDNYVLTFDPPSATITKIDAATGKVLWDRRLETASVVPTAPHNSGASLSGRHLFVYGSQTAIVDVESGAVEWSFEPTRIRKFPVKLEEPATPSSSTPSAPVAASYMPSRYARGSAMPAPAPVQYLSHLQAAGAFPMSHPGMTQPGQETRLAAPAAVWASSPLHGAARSGLLAQDRLILLGSNGLLVFRTDLPLAGRQVGVNGTLLGLAGGKVACVQAGTLLQFVNVLTGTVTAFDIARAGASGESLEAFVDGPIVYVTGANGVLGVQAHSGQLAFDAPWPEGARPKAAPASAAVPTPVVNPYGPAFYGPHGGYVMHGSHAVYGAPVPLSLRRVENGGDGRLYALVSPHRIVALAGESN